MNIFIFNRLLRTKIEKKSDTINICLNFSKGLIEKVFLLFMTTFNRTIKNEIIFY